MCAGRSPVRVIVTRVEKLTTMPILGIVRQATLSGLFILLVVLDADLVWFYWANVGMGVVLMVAMLHLKLQRMLHQV